jgi:hypothetical protein
VEIKLTKNMPQANNEYGASLKLGKSINAPFFRGGTLGFNQILHTTKHASCINANALIVHGNPTFGNSCCTIAGYTMPPVALPAAANPIARLLFLLKYVLNNASVGQNSAPFPNPQHTPWARKSCQYVVDREVMKTPKTAMKDPIRNTGRKYPASVNRPVKVPMKKSRNTCMDPTQDMSLGGRLRALT